MLGRVIRTAVITAIIFLFLALIIFNANTKPSLESKVWDMRTTIGSAEAEHHLPGGVAVVGYLTV